MANSSSRIDRLLVILGGAENLPPKTSPSLARTDELPPEKTTGVAPPSTNSSQTRNPESFKASANPTAHNSIIKHDSHVSAAAHRPFDGRKGEASALGVSFVPFLALTKYCYKYVPKDLSQIIASAFFDSNKIYNNREWDL
jgi:hypothetical protein